MTQQIVAFFVAPTTMSLDITPTHGVNTAGGVAFVQPDLAEWEAARAAALAEEGKVVSVQLPFRGRPPLLFLKGTEQARAAAMAALAEGRRPDVKLTLSASQILKTADEGWRLRQTVENHLEDLRTPVLNGHPPHPMMILGRMAAFFLRAEAAHLSKKAKTAFPGKDQRIAEAKALLLLNVIKYENADLFADLLTLLKNKFDPKNFFGTLTDVVTARHLEAAENLRLNSREGYKAVLPLAKLLDTLRISIRWGGELFPEQDFEKMESLLRRMDSQVRLAKSELRSLI